MRMEEIIEQAIKLKPTERFDLVRARYVTAWWPAPDSNGAR